MLTVGSTALMVGPCRSANWALLAKACQDSGTAHANLEQHCWVDISNGIVKLTVDTNTVATIVVNLSAAACAPAFLNAASIDVRFGGRSEEQICEDLEVDIAGSGTHATDAELAADVAVHPAPVKSVSMRPCFF